MRKEGGQVSLLELRWGPPQLSAGHQKSCLVFLAGSYNKWKTENCVLSSINL